MKTITDLVKIAFLYRQDRESQKFATKNLDFVYYKTEYQIIPFNMDKYSNTNTLCKRLKEYDYIITFEYDYDIKEMLDILAIEYKNFIPTVSYGFINYFNNIKYTKKEKLFMSKVKWNNSNEIIEKTILQLIEERKIVTTYFVEDNEIKESKITLNINETSYNTDKSEVAKNYVKSLSNAINMTEMTVFDSKKKLKNFKEKYKELL